MDKKSCQKKKARDNTGTRFRNTFSYGMARSQEDREKTIKALILLCRFRGYTANDCSNCLRLLFGESKYCGSAGTVNKEFEDLVRNPDLDLHVGDKLSHSKIKKWIDSEGVRGMVEQDLKVLKAIQAQRRQCQKKDDIHELSSQVRAFKMDHGCPPDVTAPDGRSDTGRQPCDDVRL